MNSGVNLIEPNKDAELIVPPKKLQVFRGVAVALLFLVSVTSVIVFLLVALSPLPQLKKQEQSLRLTLSESSIDIGKLALINERMISVEQLLNKRNSLEQTIILLQNKVPPGVTISALEMDKERVSVSVQSTSLQSLDSFLTGLIQAVQEKKGFSQVTLTELSTDNIKNSYSLTVKLVRI